MASRAASTASIIGCADARPGPRLGQQHADPQHAVVEVLLGDGGRRRRGRTGRRGRGPVVGARRGHQRRGHEQHGTGNHFTTIRLASVPYPARMAPTRAAATIATARDALDRRRLARWPRPVPGAVGRDRRRDRRAVARCRRQHLGPSAAGRQGDGRPRRGRRLRPGRAGAAERRRRAPRPRRQGHRHRRGGQGAVVPAVGRRHQARSRRALLRRSTGSRRRRPRHGDGDAERAAPGRRRRAVAADWRTRGWPAGGATAGAGSTRCAPR